MNLSKENSVSPQLSFMNSKDLIIVCSTYVSRVPQNFSQFIRCYFLNS